MINSSQHQWLHNLQRVGAKSLPKFTRKKEGCRGGGLASIPVLFGVDHLREVSVLHSLIPLTEKTLKLRGNLAPLSEQKDKTCPLTSVYMCMCLAWNGMT